MSDEDNNYNNEEEDEVFDLENLLNFLNTNNYQITTVFTYEKRIVFLFIINNYNGNELFLYIPSSHTIQIKEKPNNINVIKLIEVEDEENEEDNIKENLFNNNKSNELKDIEQRFERFLPLFNKESFKLCYIKNKNMIFINRHNSIDKFTLNNISDIDGIYLITDLEYFTNNYELLDKEINEFEKRFNKSITNPINNILKEYNNIIKSLEVILKKNNNINNIVEKYSERKTILDEISKKLKNNIKDVTKQKEELKNMKSELRKQHLNYIYNIENICFSFKKIKDAI